MVGLEYCGWRVDLIQVAGVDTRSAEIIRPPSGGELGAGTGCVRMNHGAAPLGFWVAISSPPAGPGVCVVT